jgi:hypothetical protein
MEISVVGWERDRGTTYIAEPNLMSAEIGAPQRDPRRVYIKVVHEEDAKGDDFPSVSIHFKASISLNSQYAARVKIDRREIARLFFLQYNDITIKEFVDLSASLGRTEYLNEKSDIEDLQISIRAQLALKGEGISTIGSLLGRTENDLLEIPRFDMKCLKQVKTELEMLGLQLKPTPLRRL